MTAPLAIAVIAVFVQVGLTFWAIVTMGRRRLASLKRRETQMGDIALDPMNFAPDVRAWQNNAHNQFETPILLYGGVALAAALGAVNWGVALGAAGYAVSRLLHRVIHVGSNHLPTRFNVFLGGLVALAVMWLSLAWALVV
ncbi:MAPEG family protein [Pontivivens ytuae]|uniref:MAPEG family protein n=1 Tax=Pontivivens ytuae TaxID=2789856 RepID=A0A7S9LQU7_9RHOB|nr:MAPEG family protein [Pontivivens ytuae]QPH53612.1 MAPEG family protein [Pontivivens ytuae]